MNLPSQLSLTRATYLTIHPNYINDKIDGSITPRTEAGVDNPYSNTAILRHLYLNGTW